MLIDYLARFDHPTVIRALTVWLFFSERDARVDCVADENRFRKAQAVVSVRESNRVDLAGGQADSNGERHGPVGDALAERGFAREFRVDVMRKVISGMAGVENHVGFGNRAAGSIARCADGIIFEVIRFRHSSVSRLVSCACRPPIATDSARLAVWSAAFTCVRSTRSPMRGRNGTERAAIASSC